MALRLYCLLSSLFDECLFGITEISAAVAEKLMEDGKAQPGGGGGDPVDRACGSYITGPGIIVDDEKTSIKEIIDLAEEHSFPGGEREIKS